MPRTAISDIDVENHTPYGREEPMASIMHSIGQPNETLLFTLAGTSKELESARLLVESIREFGGRMRRCPIWLFDFRSSQGESALPQELEIKVVPCTVPDPIAGYELADKVYACAEAERLAPAQIRSLIWLSHDNLVVNEPALYDLSHSHDAAVRPVHVKNIGLAINDPPDEFWAGVLQAAGAKPPTFPAESFVDSRTLRAYFNSHSYSVRPSVGLFRRWHECFEDLVQDREFQSSACSNELHRIFLHQAVLSTLTASMVAPNRIRVLPPSYCYPYNLQGSIPLDRRAVAVNDLVSIVYEDRSLDPGVMSDIQVHEPLRTWLESRV